MALSDTLKLSALNWLKGTAFPAAPTSVYVALFNGDPNASGTEVTTTIRTAGRVSVTFGTAAVAGGVASMSNSAPVDFGEAAAGATVTHVALYDAARAGNLLWSGPAVGQPIAIAAGLAVSFGVGDLTVSVS